MLGVYYIYTYTYIYTVILYIYCNDAYTLTRKLQRRRDVAKMIFVVAFNRFYPDMFSRIAKTISTFILMDIHTQSVSEHLVVYLR